MTKENETLLADLPVRTSVRILKIDGGEMMKSRLVGLGIMPGITVEITRNDSTGPVVVAVGNSRVALGRAMAEKIYTA